MGAAYGAIVAVFQWGWAKDVIGLEDTVPIVAFVPMMMFAVLFGLSMDYQVFLVTRMREAFVHGMSARDAVVDGFRNSARVVTAAATIMISVFGAFMLEEDPLIRSIGFALAAAVGYAPHHFQCLFTRGLGISPAAYGRALRARRAEHGLSQAELGKVLKVSRQTINAIETGRYLPSLPLAIALARHFGTSVEEMFRPDNGD